MGFESRLKQKEDLTTDLERQSSFFRGEYYYNRQTYYSLKQDQAVLIIQKVMVKPVSGYQQEYIMKIVLI